VKLGKYLKKRNLKTSREPAAKIRKSKGESIFVVQKHHARSLHYDFRLEAEGVLKSWAIPKEPGIGKRLAIMVEDHPYAYKDFEGTIPSGYGAGTVKIWDKGTYTAEGSVTEGIRKGKLQVTLKGKKLKGTYYLIRLNRPGNKQWLFFKKGEGSNQDKLYWPKEKITKGDMLKYYEEMAPWILPYLKDRPVTLKRFPNGIEGMWFYQKNLEGVPNWVETAPVKHEGKTVHYVLVQNVRTLLYVANLGSIELHPFFSRAGKLQYPDYLVFDLDPKGASFEKVIQVAQTLHQVLEEIEVPCYCKTSGATGLHIVIPLGAKYPYEEAKKFAELVAKVVHQKIPGISTLERSIAKRKGKVYIDYNQNNFAQTLAAPYSVRAKPGATVSTPLSWKEVKKGLDPKKFTIKNVLARVKKVGDLFAPVLKKGILLPRGLKNIQQLMKMGR
jgi:DNA ligase D-like protein (predicted polymerase)/DNA ligase D-like protein (predicted 3'-phosphoesterase)